MYSTPSMALIFKPFRVLTPKPKDFKFEDLANKIFVNWKVVGRVCEIFNIIKQRDYGRSSRRNYKLVLGIADIIYLDGMAEVYIWFQLEIKMTCSCRGARFQYLRFEGASRTSTVIPISQIR